MVILYFVAMAGLFSWWLTRWLAGSGSPFVLLDYPNERSLHYRPTPRTGGLAIMGVLYGGVLILGVLGLFRFLSDESTFLIDSTEWWILAATGMVSVVSLLDDRWRVSVGARLVVHFLAAILLVIGVGLVLPPLDVPMFGLISLGWAAAPATVVFFVWMANLYNFMDGADGFAGGMTVIGGGLLGYLAWQAHHPLLSILAILLSSAAGGFLIHNLPPAKIFMGDVGSVAIGFFVAALIVLGCRDEVFDLWVPLIIFSPFILDATVTLVRRVLRGEKFWNSHREHYYQRLVMGGWSHRRTVLWEYGVMVFCGGLAVLYQFAEEKWRFVILVGWVTLFVFLALAVRGVEQRMQSVSS